ncbi:MAG: hypothetical protein ABIP51_00505 [Bacteroidia bacterium]
MKNLFLCLLCFLVIKSNAQTVSEDVKTALKQKRFNEAFKNQREIDSIWFYSHIEEDWLKNGTDTTFWVLHTPSLKDQRSNFENFDIPFTTSIDYNQIEFYDSSKISNLVTKVPKKKKVKYGNGATTIFKKTYKKFVGYYKEIELIPSDYFIPDLPKNIKSDNVGYLVIRCDPNTLTKIMNTVKVTYY